MLLFLVLTASTFSLFGFIIGIWADGFEKLQIIPLLVVTPLTFLGGSFYSIDMLPPVLARPSACSTPSSIWSAASAGASSAASADVGVGDQPRADDARRGQAFLRLTVSASAMRCAASAGSLSGPATALGRAATEVRIERCADRQGADLAGVAIVGPWMLAANMLRAGGADFGRFGHGSDPWWGNHTFKMSDICDIHTLKLIQNKDAR
jgi:hypothetical protein